MADNLTLGRGKIYFARFLPGTMTPDGERYIGNTPGFSINLKEDKLDHYSSDAGVKQKDASISLSVDRTAKITCDNIDLENVALFFFGTKDTVTTVSATGKTETLSAVKKGLFYQLGTTPSTPSGVRKISNLVVSKGGTPLVLGTDYNADLDLARIELLSSGSVISAAGTDNLSLTYDVAASTRPRVISGSTAVQGAIRYVAANPQGDNQDYYFPYVNISPDGDYALKGDKFIEIPFSVEILLKSGLAAIYVDGRAV